MPTFENYWDGITKADIPPNKSSSEWQTGLHQEWLKILIRSFDIYYTSRKNVKQCSDLKKRKSMVADLEACADAGSTIRSGVFSVKEAFKHLASNDGCWKETIALNQTKFYHEKDWSIFKTFWKQGHRAGVNFMEAFDEKTKEGIDALAKFQAHAQKLQGLSQKAEKLAEKEARSAAETLKTIKECSEKVEKLLWLTARAEEIAEVAEVAGKIKTFADNVEKCSKYVESFNKSLATGFSVADDVTKGYDTYRRATAAGLSEGAAATIAALQKAVEFVPIFGELYSEVLGGIPETTDMIQKRNDELKLAMQQLNLGK